MCRRNVLQRSLTYQVIRVKSSNNFNITKRRFLIFSFSITRVFACENKCIDLFFVT